MATNLEPRRGKVEPSAHNPQVVGSSPTTATTTLLNNNIGYMGHGVKAVALAIHDEHPLAPKAINRGPNTAILRNNYFLGTTIAILLCRASNDKVMAVTIDREDLERVLDRGHWQVINVEDSRGGVKLYVVCRDKGKTIYLHRFIMDAPPKSSGIEIDHIYNRTLDNRKSEMRLASKSLNQRNKSRSGPPNRLGLRGVRKSPSGKRYIASVRVNNKSKCLGTFDTPEMAAERVRQFLIEQGANYAAGVTA